MQEDYGDYRITGSVPHTDVTGTPQGEYPVGTVQNIPVERGDALVAEGVAERVYAPSAPAETGAEDPAEEILAEAAGDAEDARLAERGAADEADSSDDDDEEEEETE